MKSKHIILERHIDQARHIVKLGHIKQQVPHIEQEPKWVLFVQEPRQSLSMIYQQGHLNRVHEQTIEQQSQWVKGTEPWAFRLQIHKQPFEISILRTPLFIILFLKPHNQLPFCLLVWLSVRSKIIRNHPIQRKFIQLGYSLHFVKRQILEHILLQCYK